MRVKLFLILFVIVQLSVSAQTLKLVKPLKDYWSFSVGDDMEWRLPSHKYTDWDKIYTGRNWESQGYDGYNGYAWYKTIFELPSGISKNNLILKLERIDDADEVYFNGKLIGQSGVFPPDVKTAHTETRKYAIPADLIHSSASNIIAVRVYDVYLDGGILGDVGIYQDVSQSYFLLNLSGKWKFKTGKNIKYKEVSFNDEDWDELNVPQRWDDQGYQFLDGYAWYRKTFNWNNSNSDGDVIVVLGRIDDKDIAYLNGRKVGSVDEMKRGPYDTLKQDYRMLRVYRVPKSMLNKGKNVLAVRVWDEGLDGGIYEGPVGIMSVKAFDNYFAEFESKKGFFEYFFESIFE